MHATVWGALVHLVLFAAVSVYGPPVPATAAEPVEDAEPAVAAEPAEDVGSSGGEEPVVSDESIEPDVVVE